MPLPKEPSKPATTLNEIPPITAPRPKKPAKKTDASDTTTTTGKAPLTLAADNERLLLAQETLTSQLATYDLTQRSYALGGSSALSVAQAQTMLGGLSPQEFMRRHWQKLRCLAPAAPSALACAQACRPQFRPGPLRQASRAPPGRP